MTAIQHYAAPTSLEEAVQTVAGGGTTLFAGGTDLMLQTRSGARTFNPLLVNLRRIPELRGITCTGGEIRVGALTTVSDILGNGLIRERAAILADTADCFASGQVRNSATLGGNICNASPAGDMIIPLILLDAGVDLASWSGGKVTGRGVPVVDFFTGPGRTRMEDGEILTGFRFPVPRDGFTARFRKFGTRPALDIAVVSVGIAGVKEDGVLRDVRVAYGAVAPVPLRGRGTEAVLEGQALDDVKIAKAAEAAMEDISPISDVRASAWYRKELVRTLTGRLLRDVMQTGN